MTKVVKRAWMIAGKVFFSLGVLIMALAGIPRAWLDLPRRAKIRRSRKNRENQI